MPEEMRHPKITLDQLELWENNPVTKAVLACFDWKRLDVRDAAGAGKFADSSNADMTHAMQHHAMGQQDAYAKATEYRELLDEYEMIAYPQQAQEETDAGE